MSTVPPVPSFPATHATHARRNNSIAVPARTQGEAIQTLTGIAGGSMLGTGQTFRTDIEALRNAYKQQVDELAAEVAAKRARGMSDAEIRPWADAERTRIARSIRMRQGPTASVVLEARDWLPPQTNPRLRRFSGYGWGGRTEPNLEARALADPRFHDSGLSMDSWLLKGAVKPNPGVTEGALRAGRYLRYGGKILIPLGVATSAYAIYEAPKGEKLKTAGVEGASWAGGAIASEAAVAALLVLAPETGGLSLLGIALIAGIGGGMAGGWGAHKLLFSNHPHAQSSVEQNGTLPAHMVQTIMPPPPAGQHR